MAFPSCTIEHAHYVEKIIPLYKIENNISGLIMFWCLFVGFWIQQKVLCAFPGDENVISELEKMEDDLNNCRYLPKREGPMLIEEIPYLDNEKSSSSNVKDLCKEAKNTSHLVQLSTSIFPW